MPKITKFCDFCKKPKERYESTIKGKNFFCSFNCKNSWQKKSLIGKNNPNYRDGHECTPHYCIDCKKEIDKHGRSSRCHQCAGKITTHSYYPNEETKKLIGLKSKAKFTPEFKNRFRKKMEESGQWIPKEKKSDWQIYFNDANWIERMFDRANEAQEQLLRKYKVFNPFTNPIGIVRDHMYSRRSGFDNCVFPEILRHPCNCDLITNSKNAGKRKGRYHDGNSKSLETLFFDIVNYKGSWKEQELCLDLIRKYESGERWKRE